MEAEIPLEPRHFMFASSGFLLLFLFLTGQGIPLDGLAIFKKFPPKPRNKFFHGGGQGAGFVADDFKQQLVALANMGHQFPAGLFLCLENLV